MSSFECKVSELNGTTDVNILKDTSSTIGINNLSLEKNTAQTKTTNTNTNASTATSTSTSTSTNSKNNSSLDKILNEKNIKSILLITVVYFLLHSEQVLEFVNVRIPSLGSNLSLNSAGKIIFGLLIGISFIVYSFFFQDP
jgi:hypothetical protein